MEEWRPIEGFSGYFVSNEGRVMGPGRYGEPNVLSPWANPQKGHLVVGLYSETGTVREYVHRLVAKAFIPNPEGYDVVRHLNDDPSDNRVCNLAWGTQTDNVRDCIRNGNFRYLTPEDIRKANEVRATPLYAKNLSTGEITWFPSQMEASRQLNIDQSSIYKVLMQDTSKIKGYSFSYSEDFPEIENPNLYSKNVPLIAKSINDGTVIRAFGETELSNMIGCSIASVSNCLLGKQKSTKGWVINYE